MGGSGGLGGLGMAEMAGAGYLAGNSSLAGQAASGGWFTTLSDYAAGGQIVQVTGSNCAWSANLITTNSSATWNVTYPITNVQAGSTQWIFQNPATYNECYRPTPEEIAKSKLEAAARQAKLEAAASRADLLLHSLLDDHQRVQITRDKFFELQVNGKTYRINRGRQGNVMLVEGGKPVAKYCAHPDIWTPDGDAMIAQMMMLKTDEASFLKTANRTALV